MLRIFRVVSIFEGCSLIGLLLIAMPANYQFGYTEVLYYTGWTHGVLWTIYFIMSLLISHFNKWSLGFWVTVLLASFLPFACFFLDRRLKAKEIVDSTPESKKDSDELLNKHVAVCYEELKEKQKVLIGRYKLGHFGGYEYDFSSGRIHFLNNGRREVSAHILPLGRYNKASNLWLWAWADESLEEGLRQKSEMLQSISELAGYEHLNGETVMADEVKGWEIAAIVSNHLDSQGCYRGALNGEYYFFSLSNVSSLD